MIKLKQDINNRNWNVVCPTATKFHFLTIMWSILNVHTMKCAITLAFWFILARYWHVATYIEYLLNEASESTQLDPASTWKCVILISAI